MAADWATSATAVGLHSNCHLLSVPSCALMVVAVVAGQLALQRGDARALLPRQASCCSAKRQSHPTHQRALLVAVGWSCCRHSRRDSNVRGLGNRPPHPPQHSRIQMARAACSRCMSHN